MKHALLLNQLKQFGNPDGRIVLGEPVEGKLLAGYATSLQGISPADLARFGRLLWEVMVGSDFRRWQSAPDGRDAYRGRGRLLWWSTGLLEAFELGVAYQRGQEAWGKRCVVVGAIGHLPVALHDGDCFDTNCVVIVPKDPAHLPAIWCFCSSPEFNRAVRAIDESPKVTNATLVKVPFDLDHWQQVADGRYPDGLPDPHSDDPTQWLFRGDIPSSTEPLQVAMARLLGYAWPDQLDDGLSYLVDADGIVTLTPLVNQEGVANRLRALLQAAYESPAPPRPKGAPDVEEPRVWDETTLPRLLDRAGYPGMSLEDWLRDKFFAAHCKLFQRRPFIWHIWDGRKDGFHAFVNYHKLDRQCLERLTHVYLGEWIERQKAALAAGDHTADSRLAAAQELQQKLEAIRIGEPPYDVFVRWKPLREQPIGWEPDLNDGVRLNIRPFVTAGILRGKLNVKWDKDRGKDPVKPREEFPWFYGCKAGAVDWMGEVRTGSAVAPRPFDGARWNDLHYSLAVKRAAREQSQ